MAYYEDQYAEEFNSEHINFWLKEFPNLLNYMYETVNKPSFKFRKKFSNFLLPANECNHLNDEKGLFKLFHSNNGKCFIITKIQSSNFSSICFLVDTKWIIDPDEITFTPDDANLIDKSLNKVFKGMMRGKIEVAIKQVEKTHVERDFREIENQVKIISSACRSDNNPRKGKNCLIKFYGCFEDKNYPNYYYLVFERAEKNLKVYLREVDEGKISEEISVKEIMKDIAEGVYHMHENNFIHFDLKLENILMVRRGDKLQACICDFGHTTEADKNGIVYFDPKHEGTEVDFNFLCKFFTAFEKFSDPLHT